MNLNVKKLKNIRFVSQRSKENIKSSSYSSDLGNEDVKESKETDYNEYEISEKKKNRKRKQVK